MNTYSLKARVSRAIVAAYFLMAFVVAYVFTHMHFTEVAGLGFVFAILVSVLGVVGFAKLAERFEAQHLVKVQEARAQQWAAEAEEAQRVQRLRADAYYRFVGDYGLSDKLANALVECDILTLADALDVEREHQRHGGSYCDELMDLLHAHEYNSVNYWGGGNFSEVDNDEDLAHAEEAYLNRAADYPYCE